MSIATVTRQIGSVTILDISGDHIIGEDRTLLRNVITDLLNQGRKQILLNLEAVGRVDSSGLGFLVTAFTTVRKHGGELKLIKPTQKVSDLMRFTKLDGVFDIQKDEGVALSSFAQSSAVSA